MIGNGNGNGNRNGNRDGRYGHSIVIATAIHCHSYKDIESIDSVATGTSRMIYVP